LIAQIATPIGAALLQCNSGKPIAGVDMKAVFAAAVAILAVSAVAPAARAEGPRASSENNWPGIAAPPSVAGYADPVYQYQPSAAEAPHYVWQEGYERGGKWHGHWDLVQ
jgi:hypothetical protein